MVGVFLFCREAAKLMQRRRFGRIVNFATVATPLKLEGEAIYAASKAAVISLTQILARELADFGITVNAVGPTPVRTDLVAGVPEATMDRLIARQAIRRYGEFRDVDNVVDFFLRAGKRLCHRPDDLSGGRLMAIEFLLDVFAAHRDDEAIVWKDSAYRYGWLLERSDQGPPVDPRRRIGAGTVTAIEADFSPQSVAMFLALVEAGAIVVPLTASVAAQRAEFLETAQVEAIAGIDGQDDVHFTRLPTAAQHEHYRTLRAVRPPGTGAVLLGLDRQEQGGRPRSDVTSSRSTACRGIACERSPSCSTITSAASTRCSTRCPTAGTIVTRPGAHARRRAAGGRATSRRASAHVADVSSTWCSSARPSRDTI